MSRRKPRDGYDFAMHVANVSMTKGPQAAVDLVQAALDDEATRPPGTTRGDLLCQLGDYLSFTGDVAGAGQVLREAVADGSVAFPDARAALLAWCLKHGDRAEADELARTIRRARPDPLVYEHVGESFEDAGDLAAATIWFTSGMQRAAGDDGSEFTYEQLAIGRMRVRRAQGFPPDEDDEFALDVLADRRSE